VDRAVPRTLLIHGTGDRLVSVENARRLARALRDRGHPVEVLEIPLAEHGFDAHAGGLADQLAQHVILRYLAGDTVSLCPPMVIKPAEIDELFDRLARALDRTLEYAKRERLFAV